MFKAQLALASFFAVLFFAPSPSHALTNSEVSESSAFSSVIQIISRAPDASGESIPAYCNGTLISKNILLTAAHCVKYAYLSRDHAFEMQTGYYKYITKPDGQSVRVGYVTKSKFQKNVNIEIPQSLADKLNRSGEKAQIGPNEDFAILWWSEATPELEGLTYASSVSPSEHAEAIKNFKSYALKVVSVNPFSMSSDSKREVALDNFKWNNGHVYSKSTGRVEEGDSGAPLFITINNQLKIFGVVKGLASTVFDNWDVYPAIHSHLCVLNKKMPTDMKIKSCL